MRIDRTVAAALAGAAAILVGGGSALAGQLADGPGSRCEARLAAIAERRGISVAELTAQIQARLTARVDAALQAGRITPARAAQLKERIAHGDCKGARAARAKIGTRMLLASAAKFLGMTRAELRAALPGTSLSALAAKQGKSEAALEAAMLEPARAKLQKTVDANRISQARADRLLDRLERRVDRLVSRVFPARQ